MPPPLIPPAFAGRRRLAGQLLIAGLGLGSVLPPARAADAGPAALQQALRQLLRDHPELVQEALDTLQQRQAQAEAARARRALAESATALRAGTGSTVLGNPAGDVTLVEFIDYRCGYCKQLSASIDQLLQRDRQLRVVVKHLPILGPDSVAAARLMLSLGQGAQAPRLHQALLAASDLAPPALQAIAASPRWPLADTRAVDQDLATVQALANRLGIQGTPAIVIGDTLVRGALETEPLAAAVAAARQRRPAARAAG